METRIEVGKMIKLPLLIVFLLILSTCLFSLIGNLIRMEREGEMTYFILVFLQSSVTQTCWSALHWIFKLFFVALRMVFSMSLLQMLSYVIQYQEWRNMWTIIFANGSHIFCDWKCFNFAYDNYMSLVGLRMHENL